MFTLLLRPTFFGINFSYAAFDWMSGIGILDISLNPQGSEMVQMIYKYHAFTVIYNLQSATLISTGFSIYWFFTFWHFLKNLYIFCIIRLRSVILEIPYFFYMGPQWHNYDYWSTVFTLILRTPQVAYHVLPPVGLHCMPFCNIPFRGA